MGILPNTAEKPESRCPIASLSLETFGKTLSTDDIEVLRHEVIYCNVACSSHTQYASIGVEIIEFAAEDPGFSRQGRQPIVWPFFPKTA